MAVVTMAVGIMGAVIGAMADSKVTKGTVVECGEAINSTAEIASMVAVATASMVEARSAAEAAASTVVAAQVMEADTGKSGFFA